MDILTGCHSFKLLQCINKVITNLTIVIEAKFTTHPEPLMRNTSTVQQFVFSKLTKNKIKKVKLYDTIYINPAGPIFIKKLK